MGVVDPDTVAIASCRSFYSRLWSFEAALCAVNKFILKTIASLSPDAQAPKNNADPIRAKQRLYDINRIALLNDFSTLNTCKNNLFEQNVAQRFTSAN